MIKGVIFDLDGTLLDTLEDIHNVVNRVLRMNDLPVKNIPEVKAAVGRGVTELVLRLFPSGELSTQRVFKVASDIRETFLLHGTVLTKPYRGIEDMLDTLARRGIPLAVLTNKPQASAEKAVSVYLPDVPFRTVQGVTPGMPMKPEAEIAMKVILKLGSAPGETLMVGDSDVDMDTAKNADLIAVGVSWGFRSVELLLEHGADVIVNDPMEICDLIFRSDNNLN
ncbi:MAG: HAD family hydrolase [Candidatus Aegiribacteria sp.]|nr:HAD family hydrolase [Candidatus Aegiribacteria sp.]